ncbi:MAG: energy-coupled thiamine transporter ThiT [Bacilli bacterium]|nr:energy-coupled thiamine transporter ThiT [Bacilli bacterium]
MKKDTNLIALLETGIFVSIAVVLDFIFGAIYSFPMGGSISIAMLPIFMISSRRGLKFGIVAGLLYGIIQTMIKVYFLSIPQYIMDYIVTFTVIGLSGLIPGSLEKPGRFALGIILGSFLRLISASIAGVLYWRVYIPDEIDFMNTIFGGNINNLFASDDAVIVFAAFLYNSLYLIPSAILCIIVGLILHKRGIIAYHLESGMR